MAESPPHIPEFASHPRVRSASQSPPVVLSLEFWVLDSEPSEFFPSIIKSHLKQGVILNCVKGSVGFSHPVEVRKNLVFTHTPGKGWGMEEGQKRTQPVLSSSLASLDREVSEQSPHPDLSSRPEMHRISSVTDALSSG